jgi:SpoVK/Ycf46/Vps4 family AAA+-type ATPase
MLDGFEGRKQVFVMGATNRPGDNIRHIAKATISCETPISVDNKFNGVMFTIIV